MLVFRELFAPTLKMFGYLLDFWWVWVGPVSSTIFFLLWINWRQTLYKNSIEWSFLELKMPRETRKSPKAMEQFFASIYGFRNAPGDWIERYIDGEVTQWFSFELVSLGGEIRFFIKTPAKHKNILIANLYSNYPNLEVVEVEDYMERFPKDLVGLYEKNYDIYGTELVFGKENPYPIKTYAAFEAVEEEKSLDPFGSILEVFGKIGEKENVVLQFLVRPADPLWRKVGEEFVDKLKNKDTKLRQGPNGEYEERAIRTPGETDLLKAIEEKISKSCFDVMIRYLYIADKSVYDMNLARRGTLAAFNQYSVQGMNYFLHNFKVQTLVKWIKPPFFFPKRRAEARKARIYINFKKRNMLNETLLGKVFSASLLNFNFKQRTMVLNTEELATLYHPPTNLVVTAPLIERVESRRMGPPVGLPIFKDEK